MKPGNLLLKQGANSGLQQQDEDFNLSSLAEVFLLLYFNIIIQKETLL